MVFRRDNKPEFQRQMGALREQLGGRDEAPRQQEPEPYVEPQRADAAYAVSPVREVASSPRDSGGYVFGSYGSSPVATPEATPVVPPVDAQTTVIATETIWRGDLETRGSIHIHGRLEGSVTAAKEIYVAEDAEVEATLMAATVIVAGKVTGEVRCTTRFEMLPSGRVDGNIQAPSLVVHEGASITGQFRMGAPEQNADSKLSTVMNRRPARGTA
jgi:cytoskeletal protein CcmA (bactofilin family)